MSTVAISAGAALLAAVLSTWGALYVGRRNRETGLHVAEFQKQVAAEVSRQQQLRTLGARALLIGERASELRNGSATFREVPSSVRTSEIQRRLTRLDTACDLFVESWVEFSGRVPDTTRLLRLVDELSNSLESVRLLVSMDDDSEQQVLALREVTQIARSVHRLCLEAANDVVMPVAREMRTVTDIRLLDRDAPGGTRTRDARLKRPPL
jgi:hypothetical protein